MKTLLLLLLLSFSAFAQSISATTADGKKVVLNGDGTWKFADSLPTSASLAIEAALIYQNGDVKPIANTDFLLLDADLGEILTKANLTPPGNLSLITSDASLQRIIGFAKAALNAPDHEAFFSDAQRAIRPHVVKTFTTGFDGKATVDGLPSKTLYLVGVARAANGWAVWNLKVAVTGGVNKIQISQSNAAFYR